MSKSLATHKSVCGKFLYRTIPDQPYHWLNPLYTGVEFWDKHTNQWRPSIMKKSEIVEIATK